MRVFHRACFVIGRKGPKDDNHKSAFALIALGALAACGGAQEAIKATTANLDPSSAAILALTDAAPDTPDGKGYTFIALQESQTGILHADLTASSSTLEDIQLYAGHVMHALDRARIKCVPSPVSWLTVSTKTATVPSLVPNSRAAFQQRDSNWPSPNEH